MFTRKKAALLILLLSTVLFALLPALYFLNLALLGSATLLEFSAFLFRDFYFTILPGLLLLGLILYFFDKLETGAKEPGRLDYIWIALWMIALLTFVRAYTAGADSFLVLADPFLPFLKSSVRTELFLGPRLDAFLLWNSFSVLIIATIFLFFTMQRFGIDRKQGGVLLINVLIALFFALLLLTNFFHGMEENVVSALYQNLRNPGTEKIPDLAFQGSSLNYCTSPKTKEEIERRIQFNNDVVRLAHARGKASLTTLGFPRIPTPKGIRDDIEIIGVTTSDIEAVNFQWPLDWEIYGNISRNFSNFQNSILVYDINFMDIKGISGGNKCNDPEDGFRCLPFPGKKLRNQTEYLSQSIAMNRNRVLADYPVYVTTEQKAVLKNYQQRLALLQRTSTIKHIKNGRYGVSMAALPVPPIVPVAKHLDLMGHANVFIDQTTHINRRVPLVIRVINYEKYGDPDYNPDIHDSYYPGIALSTVLAYFGVDPTKDVEVDFLAGTLTIKNIPKRTFKKVDFEKGGLIDVDIMAHPNPSRSITIPMTREGLMDINFRGGLYCFPYKPILEVAWDWKKRERMRIRRIEQERNRIREMSDEDFAAYVGSTLPNLLAYRHDLIMQLHQRYKAASKAELARLPYYRQLVQRLRSATKAKERLAIAREVKQKDPELYAYLVKEKYRSYTPQEMEARSFENKTNLQSRYKGKIALVAMYYATGVDTAKDVHLSPYGNMAGIEHQAYAINTILNQDFARDAGRGMDLSILLFIALLIGFFLPRVSTIMSFVLSLLIAISFIVFTIYVSFGLYSYLHVFPTVIIEQILILISFIGFRVFAEEENVKYIRNTFSKFVSQDVVEELLSNPDALGLGGAKKEVTVFFSDVRGFTTISEKLSPEELVHLLNEYLSVMTDIIIEYRGTIDKYMGDAIMAFWGAPVENDDHAYYTCVAAIAQYRALGELQKMWHERGVPAIDIGIGINTGAAVVGNMGSNARMDYTLMGDTVNLGSRLEGITKQYGVKMVISEYTYERVKDRIYARELDLVRVKGKLEPVRIYELMGLKDDSDLEKLRTKKGAP